MITIRDIMHIFEYSEIAVSIPSDIVDTLLDIERIRAFDSMRMSRYSKELGYAKHACIIEDAAATARLEDLHMDSDRISALLDGKDPSDDGESVMAGTLKALATEPGGFSLDEASVLHLHRTVVNGTTRRESRFRYREAQDIESEHTRAIRPVPPEDVRSAFNQMSESYSMADSIGIRPILLAPCAVLDFLNIYPFPEANWMISRMILRELLSKEYPAIGLVPFDSVISEDSEGYYDAVSESSTGWRNNTNDPYGFVRYVAETVLSCYREFETRYPLDDGRKTDKTGRIENILRRNGGEMTKTEICRRMPDLSRRTADKALTELVKEGRITKNGTFRDARYRMG